MSYGETSLNIVIVTAGYRLHPLVERDALCCFVRALQRHNFSLFQGQGLVGAIKWNPHYNRRMHIASALGQEVIIWDMAVKVPHSAVSRFITNLGGVSSHTIDVPVRSTVNHLEMRNGSCEC